VRSALAIMQLRKNALICVKRTWYNVWHKFFVEQVALFMNVFDFMKNVEMYTKMLMLSF